MMLCKRFALYVAPLIMFPVMAAFACTNDCQCGLGGKCFYLPGIIDGLCVNTPLTTHHVHEDYFHLCVVIDVNRDVKLSELADLSVEELKGQLVRHSRESYKTLTHRRCACPYDINSYGVQCGNHSAYIRTERMSPLCYIDDINDRHVEQFKAANRTF